MKKFVHLRILPAMFLSMVLTGCANSENKTAQIPQSAIAAEKQTYVSSRPEDFPAFLALPQDEPIDMLNMIRFKDLAKYEPDSGFADKGWTGAQAYAEYSRRSQEAIDRMDAEIIYAGNPAMTLIGPTDETWDAIFILRYDSVAAFGELMRDSKYRAHAFHRKAAVADSRLVRLAPAAKTMPVFD